MRPAIRMLLTILIAVLAGCVLRDNAGWTGHSVVTVHWARYKSVDSICRRMASVQPNDSDPPEFIFGCGKNRGTDCYVYTDEDRADLIGGLVQGCLEHLNGKANAATQTK
jgi:hypothetical protein